MSKTTSSEPDIDFEYYESRAKQLHNDAIRNFLSAGAMSVTGAVSRIKRMLTKDTCTRRRPHVDGRFPAP